MGRIRWLIDSSNPVWILLAISLFLSECGQLFGQDEASASSLDGILDTSPVLSTEVLLPQDLQLPDAMQEVIVPITADERQELSAWVRWMVLKNLPPNFEDNRDWNKKKDLVNGLHVHREGLKIETKRKRKLMNHGTWTRYKVEFKDPEKELVVDISKIEFPEPGRIDVSCRIEAPLSLFGRMSQWQRDVQWFSLSMDGHARVEMTFDSTIRIHLNPLKLPPDVQFSPVITAAKVRLKEFEVEHVSRVGGDAAEWIGKGLKKVLEDKLVDYDDKLVEKMNRSIEKQKSKLTLSISDWFNKKIADQTK